MTWNGSGEHIFTTEKNTISTVTVSPDANREKGLRATVRSGYLFELNTAEHVVIRNLTFCGSAHENPRLSSLAVAIRTIRTRNILVENCHFHYNSGGVGVTANSIGCTARNCFFLRNEARGYGEAVQLFFGGKSKYCLAENNIIADTEVHGLRFYSGAEHCTARGNIIVNAKSSDFTTKPPVPRVWQSGMS
ncbi:MAG: right-handed parallel beta-helix repeat-containing protein [Victivallales bacterium]